jgi:hypothetical protein
MINILLFTVIAFVISIDISFLILGYNEKILYLSDFIFFICLSCVRFNSTKTNDSIKFKFFDAFDNKFLNEKIIVVDKNYIDTKLHLNGYLEKVS